MRIEKLKSNGQWNFSLDLHPYVTVIHGLGPERRARLSAMLSAICHGDIEAIDAQVNVDEKSQLLTAQLVDELELAHTQSDLVLREVDLPGAVVVQEFPKPVEANVQKQEVTDEQLRAEIAAEFPDPVWIEPVRQEVHDLHPLNPSLADRHQLVGVMEEDVNGPLRTSFVAMDRAYKEIKYSEEQLELAGQSASPEDLPSPEQLAQELEAAEERVRIAERALYEIDNREELLVDLQRQLEAFHNEASLLSTRRDALAAEIPNSEDDVDTTGVQAALKALQEAREAAVGELGDVDPRALELAEEWNQVRDEISNVPPSKAPSWLVEQTKDALDEARHRVHSAEIELRMASADRADIENIESTHAAVVAAENSGKRRDRKNLDQLRQDEQAALEKIGVATYEAFRLQLGSLGRDKDVVQRMLDSARKELTDAESMWEELQLPSDDPAVQGLRERQNDLYERACELLKFRPEPSMVAEELQHLRPEAPNLEANEKLVWEELKRVGIPKSPAPVELIAETWLSERQQRDENSDIQRKRDELRDVTEALASVERDTHRLRDELVAYKTRGEEEAANRPQLLADVAKAHSSLETVKERHADIESRRKRAASVANEISDLRAAHDAATRVYQQARQIFLDGSEKLKQQRGTVEDFETMRTRSRQAFESRLSIVQAEREKIFQERKHQIAAEKIQSNAAGRWDYPLFRPPDVDLSEINIEEVEVYLLSRLSALRIVGVAGSLPLVIDDAFSGLDDDQLVGLLSLLERVSKVVQIIYLSDDERFKEWTDFLGPERSSFQRFSAA